MIDYSRRCNVEACYDRVADCYARAFSSLKFRRREYDFILKALPEKPGRVLDLGCGNGVLLKTIAPFATSAVGLDVSRNMVRLAEKNAGGEANISILHHRGFPLPFPDESFDCVFAAFSLRYFPAEAALKLPKPLGAGLACALLFLAALATHLVGAGLIGIASCFLAGRYILLRLPSWKKRLLFLGAGALVAAAALVFLLLFRFQDIAFFLQEFSPLDALRQYGILLSSSRPPVIRWELFLSSLIWLPLALVVLVFFRRSPAVVRCAALLLLCLSVPLLRFSWDSTAYRFLLQAPLFALIIVPGIFYFKTPINKKSALKIALSFIPLLITLPLAPFLPEKMRYLKLNYQPDYPALQALVAPVKARVAAARLLVAHKGLSSLLWYETGVRATHFMPTKDLDRCRRVVNGFGPMHFEEYRLSGEEPPLEITEQYTLVDERTWQRFYYSRKDDIYFLSSWLNPNQSAPEHVGWTGDEGER
jgi:SAM-dependent methyltransferase